MSTYRVLPPVGSMYFADPVQTVSELPTTDPENTVRLVGDDGLLYYYDGASWLVVAGAISASSVADTDSIDQTVTLGVLTSDLRLSSNAASANNQLVALNIESAVSKGLRAQIPDVSIRGLFSGTAPVSYNSATGALSMAAATSGNNGYLTSADWTTFNGKVSTSRSISTTAPLTGGGDLSADRTLSIPAATSGQNGYLTSTDWSTFNSKEGAITATTSADYYRGDKTFQALNLAALGVVTGGGSASAGKLGEILSASQASNTTSNVASTGVWGFATSVSLTAGVWQITGAVGFNENGATLTTAVSCGVSASSSGSGISEFDTTVAPFLISSTSDALIHTPVVYVSISSTTTYYLNTLFNYTSGTPRHRGRIQALRIR